MNQRDQIKEMKGQLKRFSVRSVVSCPKDLPRALGDPIEVGSFRKARGHLPRVLDNYRNNAAIFPIHGFSIIPQIGLNMILVITWAYLSIA